VRLGAAVRFFTARFATAVRAAALRLAAAVMPIASVAIAAACAVAVCVTVVCVRTIAIGIAVGAFAAFEQAFLPPGCATPAATATAATPAATSTTRAHTALAARRAFGARSAGCHIAFGAAVRFVHAAGDSARCHRTGCDTACDRCIRTQRRRGCG
jgi:hypothetical protein